MPYLSCYFVPSLVLVADMMLLVGRGPGLADTIDEVYCIKFCRFMSDLFLAFHYKTIANRLKHTHSPCSVLIYQRFVNSKLNVDIQKDRWLVVSLCAAAHIPLLNCPLGILLLQALDSFSCIFDYIGSSTYGKCLMFQGSEHRFQDVCSRDILYMFLGVGELDWGRCQPFHQWHTSLPWAFCFYHQAQSARYIPMFQRWPLP